MRTRVKPNRIALTLSLVLAPLTLAVTEREARALGPIDLEAGVKAGVGTNPESTGPNPYGVGLGARAGVGIFHLYLGATAIHYFGGSFDFPAPISTKVDYSSTLFGVELGYTISAIPLVDIRPQIGLGSASFSASSNGTSSSTSKFYLEPGLTVIVPLGLLFVGADANALIVPGVDTPAGTSKSYTSFTLHGQLGIRL
jgi:hypothetical protein